MTVTVVCQGGILSRRTGEKKWPWVSANDMYTANLPSALMANTPDSLPGLGTASYQWKKHSAVSGIYVMQYWPKTRILNPDLHFSFTRLPFNYRIFIQWIQQHIHRFLKPAHELQLSNHSLATVTKNSKSVGLWISPHAAARGSVVEW